MRYFININNIEELKKKYREYAVKLHPDNGGITAKFQEMHAEFIKLFEELKEVHNKTVDESGKGFKRYEDPEEYAEIINQLIKLQGIDIELCGVWLWIGGDTKPHKEKLKSLGCRYASNKQMWYYRCEIYASNKKQKRMNMEEIREKYGSQKIELLRLAI